MSCCNQCFEVNLGKVDPRQVQGHHLCSAPTEGQVALFAYGVHPTFQENRWYADEATTAFIDEDGVQVWFHIGDHFKVINGEAVAVDSPAPPSLSEIYLCPKGRKGDG